MTSEVLHQPFIAVSSVPKGLRTLIVGAGQAGRALARDLQRVDRFGLTPVGFLDDDAAKRKVRHLPVLGGLSDLLTVATAHRIDVVVLAIPGLSEADVARLATAAARVGASVRRLPSFVALLQREVVGTDLRSLHVADLIGRTEVHLASLAVAEIIEGRTVLVTGAGGSIGSELCRQLNGFVPSQLVMLDHDESNLHRLQLELQGEAFLDAQDAVVADIRDADRMRQVMREYRPDVVFHAAALKHLPMLEQHPCEGVKSNVQGTDNVLRAAVEFGVERVVVISTDKAADPTSVLGATKALAEQVGRMRSGGRTVLSAVRFGNVLGSRGSLLPVILAQLAAGVPVTVTHPDVTRYFMTIEEAVGLVLEATLLTKGCETFVLDMGSPVRIVDLVANFARQLGVPDVKMRFTGLRPGEKLHESLFSETEECLPTAHPRIFGAQAVQPHVDFETRMAALYDAAHRNAVEEVRELLREALPVYHPDVRPALDLVRSAPYPDDY
ncbi:MAG: polysaccharide biosynthesis protein [Actinomycetota bacterium]|nr:polysaccharide biosynthesis protein [Actinomycetota bacterium]